MSILTSERSTAGRLAEAGPCEIRLEPNGPMCGRSPARPLRTICVHEHIEESVACAGCISVPLYCAPCADKGCMHCPSQVVTS